MPARMHSEYLRRLFLDNDFAEGRHLVDGKPVALTDIRAPIFAVGTETDHVAPWRSVYKFRILADTDVTFLLTTGGHNAGIVSGVHNTRRSYRVASAAVTDTYIDPEIWLAQVPHRQGSWWPGVEWVRACSGEDVAPPRLGNIDPTCPAPGSYVYAR
jgi:polyhydroxyalkanoate synthase subunit PhaC